MKIDASFNFGGRVREQAQTVDVYYSQATPSFGK